MIQLSFLYLKKSLDAGFLVEQGSLVVSCVDSTLGCHDLTHNAVILLLEGRDEEGFTEGIILRRP